MRKYVTTTVSWFKDFYFIENEVILNDESIDLAYKFYEGPKYFHRSVKWNGNDLISDSTLTESLNINKGDVYSVDRFNISLIDDVRSSQDDTAIILHLNGDFIESQAFAYLGVRSHLKLPISFPETTGCNKPCTGGVAVKNY